MVSKWREIRGAFSPEAEERIRKSVEEAAVVMLEFEKQDNEEKTAALRAAIDAGLESGIAEPDVLPRLRERHGLPRRET